VTTPDLRDHAAIDRFLEHHRAELVAFRRHLHSHPELSNEERETTDLVAQRLTTAGLAPVVLPDGCGLVCDITGPSGRGSGEYGPGEGGGPVVALRADLDALAMDDEKDVAYRSQRPGVAHACGHDVHTTVVLGAGLALAELLADGAAGPGARVRLLFEPAEESAPSGALRIIEAGALKDVQAVFGLHCDPKLDAGRVGVRSGPLTAAADLIGLDLHGPGGHTARPGLTVDLVRVAATVVSGLPDLIRERARGDVLVVFGMLTAGHAANVIPAHAQLRGTLRTHDLDVWKDAERLVHDAVAELVGPTGARFTLDYLQGTPPVVNDAVETERVAAVARAIVGPDAVEEAPQSYGGDSFAWYVEQVPGSYARLGVHDPARAGDRLDLHSSTFDVDERAIDVGVGLLALTALDALRAPS
jgi:amidohydrolase